MTYHKDPKSYMRNYMKERYHRRRKQAIELLGGKCAHCGTSEALEVDHIDPALKTMTVTRMYSMSEPKFLAELAKCQLLCNTHHVEKSKAEREVPHGGGASGKRNCPCIPCKTRKAEYQRERYSITLP
jgi:5-methylcytosine-specific restriction endonuclease McrA